MIVIVFQHDVDDLKRQNSHLEEQIRALERAKSLGNFASVEDILSESGLVSDATLFQNDVFCFSTSFQVLRAPESWSKPFFQTFFNLLCSFQSFFSDFTAEINKRCLKMNQKNVVLSTPQSWSTCKSWSTP